MLFFAPNYSKLFQIPVILGNADSLLLTGSGECSQAVAGGTNVFTSPFDYKNLHAAGFLSPSGGCKPFDASADGYCRGEGVGVVVLKPLSDAIKENDNILGLIVGSAANQNHNYSHITVPHSQSQTKLYRGVLNHAGVQPESVSYIEAAQAQVSICLVFYNSSSHL